MRKIFFMLGFAFLLCLSAIATVEKVFNFEDGTTQGWDIPEWQGEYKDYVTKSVTVGTNEAVGGNALAVVGDFPGNKWKASCVEKILDMDLTEYKSISADIYLPKEAHTELMQAKIILTVGPWYFVEMRGAVPLVRGKWVNVKAKLDVNDKDETTYWRVKETNKEVGLLANIKRVRRAAIRIEYNASSEKNTGSPYNGPVYIKNIVIK